MEVNINSQPGISIRSINQSKQRQGTQTSSDGMTDYKDIKVPEGSREELEKAVNGLNKWVQQTQSTHLKFYLHDKLNEYYVEVVDDQSKEVIRQIPSKKILDFTAKMQEMIGLLVDEKR